MQEILKWREGSDFFSLSRLTEVTVSWSEERNCAFVPSLIGHEMFTKRMIITSLETWLYSRERMRLFPPTTTLWTHSFTACSDCNDGEKGNSSNCFSVLLPTHSPIFSEIHLDVTMTSTNLTTPVNVVLVVLPTVAPVPCLLYWHYQHTMFL